MQFISNLLQGRKNMMAFCSTVQKSHWLPILGWKSRQRVDFKIRITSISSQEKEKNLCRANKEMGANAFYSRELKIWQGARRLLMFKTRTVQVIKCEFCAERSSEGSLISKISSEFTWSSIFWVLSYRESIVLMNFQHFLLHFK